MLLLDTISKKLSGVRQEADGSITANCPVCEAEGHQNKTIKIYVGTDGHITGIGCVRFSSAGNVANREHCKPIRELFGIGGAAPTFISQSLFDGKLTLEVTPAERGKVLLVGRNCSSVLHRDVCSLDKAEDRLRFIKRLNLDGEQQAEVNQALLVLADRYASAKAAIGEEECDERETKQAIFAELTDGRLIEQIAGGQYAVYDPERGEVTYHRKVEDDLHVYEPLKDDFVLRGGLFLPERLVEYGDEATLDADIEACISRYSDVPARDLKISAKYPRLT